MRSRPSVPSAVSPWKRLRHAPKPWRRTMESTANEADIVPVADIFGPGIAEPEPEEASSPPPSPAPRRTGRSRFTSSCRRLGGGSRSSLGARGRSSGLASLAAGGAETRSKPAEPSGQSPELLPMGRPLQPRQQQLLSSASFSRQLPDGRDGEVALAKWPGGHILRQLHRQRPWIDLADFEAGQSIRISSGMKSAGQ